MSSDRPNHNQQLEPLPLSELILMNEGDSFISRLQQSAPEPGDTREFYDRSERTIRMKRRVLGDRYSYVIIEAADGSFWTIRGNVGNMGRNTLDVPYGTEHFFRLPPVVSPGSEPTSRRKPWVVDLRSTANPLGAIGDFQRAFKESYGFKFDYEFDNSRGFLYLFPDRMTVIQTKVIDDWISSTERTPGS